MSRKIFFGKRVISAYTAIVLIAFGCVLKIFAINSDEKIKTVRQNNGYRLKLADMRHTIFDCNMNPITNCDEKILAVVYPTPRAITAVSSLLSKKDFEDLKKRLYSGTPAVVELPKETECDGIFCFKIKTEKLADNSCAQLIGYLDADGQGVMGIQKAYNERLSHEPISAFVPADSSGKLLLGASAQLSCDLTDYNSGIMLTIDNSLQTVVKNAMKNVKSGAAIVSEVKTGKIRAMVSLPDFDVLNVSEYLKNEDSPFLNRALSCYNVGSVFKPVVAAALLEDGKFSDFKYFCSGSTEIDNHTFACHNLSGHGLMDLKNAITQSCNVFFYNAAQKIGAQKILETASLFRFGSSLDIGGIYTQAGSFPKIADYQSPTDLANLSIGQGEILLSPVSLLTVYEAIANGGIYHVPTIFEGEIENGVKKSAKISAPTRAFSEKTADFLKDSLENVVTLGTGSTAKCKNTTVAGKTATAQTGWQKNGKFIQNSWFCGFFPADNPKYTVVIMIDDTEKNGTFGAPIFKNIAEGITLLEKSLDKEGK